MGRTADIKRHESHPSGQPMELFGFRSGRLPVVLELLRSPWIVRGSELRTSSGADAGSRLVGEEVAVVWDSGCGCPAAFRWRGRPYPVDAVAQTWAVERWWWSPSRRVSRRCFRVLARGGVYDLAYDRLASRWVLLGVAD